MNTFATEGKPETWVENVSRAFDFFRSPGAFAVLFKIFETSKLY